MFTGFFVLFADFKQKMLQCGKRRKTKVKHTNNYTNKNTENDPKNSLKNGTNPICSKVDLSLLSLGFLTVSFFYLVPDGRGCLCLFFLLIFIRNSLFWLFWPCYELVFGNG